MYSELFFSCENIRSHQVSTEKGYHENPPPIFKTMLEEYLKNTLRLLQINIPTLFSRFKFCVIFSIILHKFLDRISILSAYGHIRICHSPLSCSLSKPYAMLKNKNVRIVKLIILTCKEELYLDEKEDRTFQLWKKIECFIWLILE